jgi:hypothetical protein
MMWLPLSYFGLFMMCCFCLVLFWFAYNVLFGLGLFLAGQAQLGTVDEPGGRPSQNLFLDQGQGKE